VSDDLRSALARHRAHRAWVRRNYDPPAGRVYRGEPIMIDADEAADLLALADAYARTIPRGGTMGDDELRLAAERLAESAEAWIGCQPADTFEQDTEDVEWWKLESTVARGLLARLPPAASEPMHAGASDVTHEFGPGAYPAAGLTDAELADAEKFPGDQRTPTIRRLVAEVRRLLAQVAGHCDRIAAQSEILSRRAEGPTLLDELFDPKPGTVEKLADLLRSRPADPWRPISTAPRDGTRVLLWDEQGVELIGSYRPGSRWYTDRGDVVKPTGWMPLPPPPPA
jgi:hypothetical protein